MPNSSRADEILVFLPAYNDLAGIEAMVRDIQQQSPRYRVLIIDDGSTVSLDGEAPPAGCLSVRLPDNYGLGVCTHVAFDHALRHGYKAAVRLDADGQHPADRIGDLVEVLESGRADLAVGGRVNRNDGRGLRAAMGRLMKGYFSLGAKLITRGRAPSDVNTGFTAFSRSAIVALNRHALERYPEPQIFILAVREGLRIVEIEVQQKERRSGRSTIGLSHAVRLFYRFNIFLLRAFLQGSR